MSETTTEEDRTKEERDRWCAWGIINPSDRCIQVRCLSKQIDRLEARLARAAKALEQQHEALVPNKQLPHSLCGVCTLLAELRGQKGGQGGR